VRRPGTRCGCRTKPWTPWRFESLLAAARTDAGGRPERARHHLGQALALWCGPAYAEFADEEWAAAEVARLTEQHLAAQEAWAEIALRTGAAAEAVPAAEALIRQQPLREGSWRLLALSLWACDRQADALAALRRARRILRDELGLEPGPALAEVEEAILGQHQEVLRRAQARPAGRTSQADEPSAGRTSQAEEPTRAADDRSSGAATSSGRSPPRRRGAPGAWS
jgi:DNA-binding SARP family transcriptional activator